MRKWSRILLVTVVVAGMIGIPALNAGAGGPVVGYYDMGGSGDVDQEPPILAAGGTPVRLFDVSSADLAGIDVLFAQNGSNGTWGSEYRSRLADIDAWVAAGGVLIIHDRCVADSDGCGWYNVTDHNDRGVGPMLPGGDDIVTDRDFDFSADIDVLDGSTPVTDGPGGTVNDDTLDFGNSSTHGFIVASSLPAGAINPLARGDQYGGDDAEGAGSAPESGTASPQQQQDWGWGPPPGGTAVRPDEVVTTCYPYQAGRVIYSTIPLDFYLDGFGNNPPADAMREIYAPNVVAWGMGHCGGGGGPDGQMLRTYLHANGAGPGRHTARLEVRNGGQRGSGWATLEVFLPGASPSSTQRQQVMLAQNQMGSYWFSFQKPSGPGGWGTRAYQIRTCIVLTGDTEPANNCVTQSFSM